MLKRAFGSKNERFVISCSSRFVRYFLSTYGELAFREFRGVRKECNGFFTYL